jgi:hypothetical protein
MQYRLLAKKLRVHLQCHLRHQNATLRARDVDVKDVNSSSFFVRVDPRLCSVTEAAVRAVETPV